MNQIEPENSYQSLAYVYDNLTTDVNYEKWADYIHTHFKNHSISGNILLDLACGTGSLTFQLAKLGYEMIGVDNSPDMLCKATEKSSNFPENPPLFLCQSMENLDLYGTIDGCVCCLDSINYITDPNTLQKAFDRVSLFLIPEGLFLFDIKTPETFLAQNGQMSLDETDDLYCVWRTEIDENKEICTHFMDIFTRDDDIWLREEEIHHQHLYHPDFLTTALTKAGFSNIRQFGTLTMESPTPSDQRIFFLAEKSK